MNQIDEIRALRKENMELKRLLKKAEEEVTAYQTLNKPTELSCKSCGSKDIFHGGDDHLIYTQCHHCNFREETIV